MKESGLFKLAPQRPSVAVVTAPIEDKPARLHVDLPADLFRQAKARAALSGLSLRELVIEAIEARISR